MFVGNYLAHLSPRFLFLSGDSNLRHSVLSMGELYHFEFPLLCLALYGIFRKGREHDVLVVLWALLGIVPAALTNESVPHALRCIASVPAFALLSGRGFGELLTLCKPKRVARLSAIALAVVVPLSVGMFLGDYFVDYPVYSAADWEYGWREALTRVIIEKENHPHTIISGMTSYPEIFVYFYTQYPPKQAQAGSFEGFYFLPFGAESKQYVERFPRPALFLGRPNEFPELPASHVVRYPDGEPAWKIIAFE